MVEIISRAVWGARPPRSVTSVELSRRREFIVHYSGASETQTVRAIQDFHMDTKGWTDIGYNFLCDHLGRLYMGRGWYALGTHTVGFNTSGIACCFIGTNADVTEAAKRSIRWLADEANRLTGRALQRGGHRDYDATTCPGDNLWAWVHSGMPIGEDDDMQQNEDIAAPTNLATRTVGAAIADLSNLRDWLIGAGDIIPGRPGEWPKAGSPLALMVGAAQRPPVELTAEQVDTMAGRVADRLAEAPDNPLGDADKPAIVAAVKQALSEGVG